VLRDITERIVVASKGRFDRAVNQRDRQNRSLPSEISIFKDEFMEATLDVWDIPPESATRVNHPAPFPVELPKRLIDLYTYRDDVVLDPFSGSGSSAVAAVRTGRHFLGFEIDDSYRDIALKRIAQERADLERAHAEERAHRVRLSAADIEVASNGSFAAHAVKDGARAKEIALELLRHSGFREITPNPRFLAGIELDFSARDARGRPWCFDVSGAFSSSRQGLRRAETLWKALGKAAVLREANGTSYRLIFLSTDLPLKGTSGDRILRSARGSIYHDALEMLSTVGRERLNLYAAGDGYEEPFGELLSPTEITQT
nr:site-specific DNA-methyltransferase [Actinomycetota bacterium]